MRVTYYGRELYHAEERAGHRYIARIPFGDKFRYFYDQAELAAYKAGKAMGGAAKAAGKAVEGAGRNLQGAANVAGRSASKYMNTASKAVEGAGRNLQGAANTARKSASKYMNTASKAVEGAGRNLQGAANTASKAVQDKMTKVQNDMYSAKLQKRAKKSAQNMADVKKKYEGQRFYNGETVNKSIEKQQNVSASKKAKTRKWDERVDGYSRNLEELNKSKAKTEQDFYKEQASEEAKKKTAVKKKAVKRIDDTLNKGKNNAPKNNQGIVNTTGKNNAPKSNQGIAPEKKKEYPRSAPRYVTETDSLHYDEKQVKDLFDRHGGKVPVILGYPHASSLLEQQKKTYNVNAPKKNQGVVNGKTASQLGHESWSKGTGDLKNSVKTDKTNLLSGASDAANVSTAKANKAAKATKHKDEISTSKRLKALEKQFEARYLADGHSSADARRWAKNAAENQLKKEKK